MASGILNVDKPAGPTSFGIVRSIKRLPGVRKVGHGGTLDPAADGVLPILVNAGTRLADFVHEWPKRYLAGVTLGAVSDTDDRDGVISLTGSTEGLTASQIEVLLPSFTGRIMQVPPIYSALKRGGEPLYRKARRGETVELAARPVQIDAITLRAYDQAAGLAKLEVRCQRGTYVRSLARDLGAMLGCGGYLSSLTRLSVGPLEKKSAVSPAELLAMGESWTDALLPLDLPLRGWPAIVLDDLGAGAVRQGQSVRAPLEGDGRYRLLAPDGEMVAWGEVVGDRVQPRAVFTE